MAKIDEYLSQRTDSPVGDIPLNKRVSIGTGGAGRGRPGGRAEAPTFARPQMEGFTPMSQVYAAGAGEREWMDYPRALGAGSGSMVKGLGTAADVVGAGVSRLAQNAAQWLNPELTDIRDTPEGLAMVEGNFLSDAGRGMQRAGRAAENYYIGNMSEASQAELSRSLFEDPSVGGFALRLAMSAPSMVVSGGVGLGMRAGALARGATEAAALRSAQAGFIGTGAAIQGGSVASDAYDRVKRTPYEVIAETNPDGWAGALRRAGGNQEIAREIVARQVRDVSFYTAAAISAGSNLAMGTGPAALLGQQPVRSMTSRVVGREGAQEFIEEGGGRAASGLAEVALANREAPVFAPAVLAGAEGWALGRAMDVKSDIGAVRTAIANWRSQPQATPAGAPIDTPQNLDIGSARADRGVPGGASLVPQGWQGAGDVAPSLAARREAMLGRQRDRYQQQARGVMATAPTGAQGDLFGAPGVNEYPVETGRGPVQQFVPGAQPNTLVQPDMFSGMEAADSLAAQRSAEVAAAAPQPGGMADMFGGPTRQGGMSVDTSGAPEAQGAPDIEGTFSLIESIRSLRETAAGLKGKDGKARAARLLAQAQTLEAQLSPQVRSLVAQAESLRAQAAKVRGKAEKRALLDQADAVSDQIASSIEGAATPVGPDLWRATDAADRARVDAELGFGVPMFPPEVRAPMRPVPDTAAPQGVRLAGAPIGLPSVMPGQMADMFGGRPSAAPAAPVSAEDSAAPATSLGQQDLFRARTPGQEAVFPTRQPVASAEPRAPEQDVENIDIIRQQAIALRKRAKMATGASRDALLASADALDQQADAARSIALRQSSEATAAAAGQVSPQARLPAPEGAPVTGGLPANYRGAKLKSWIGMTAAELDAVAASANELAVQATDAKQRADYTKSAQDATMAAAWLRAGQPKGSLKLPKAAPPKVEEPKPAAAKPASKSMQKPKADAEADTQNAEKAFQNVIHDRPALQVGKPKEDTHVSEDGYTYRTMSPAELQDAKESGIFRSRGGKSSGGRTNVKHWVRGGTGQFFHRGAGGGVLVRVRNSDITTDAPVAFSVAEVRNEQTGEFEPAAKKPAASKPVKKIAPEKAPTEAKATPDKLFAEMRAATTRAEAVAAAEKLHGLGAIDKSTMDDVRAANVKGAEASDIVEAVDDGLARAAEAPKAKGLKKAQPGAAAAVTPAAKKASPSTRKTKPLASKTGKTAAAGTGVALAEAESVVNAALKRLGVSAENRKKVVVVANPDDAALDNVDVDAKGAYDPDTDTVYVFADRNIDAYQVLFTLNHELVGHLGLRATYGARLTYALQALLDNPQFRSVVERVRKVDRREGDDVVVAEEVVGDLAGMNITDDASLVDRLLVGVDDVVRKFGLNKGMSTDKETQRRIRVIIANSKRTLRGPRPLAAALAWNVVSRGFSELSDDPRNFKYQFSDSKAFRDHLRAVVGDERVGEWAVEETPTYNGVKVDAYHKPSGWSASVQRAGSAWEIGINPRGVKNQSFGAGIYQALMHHAAMNNMRVLGDDITLYAGNELRRTDAMLSAILREGGQTFMHRPSIWQFTGLLPKEYRDQLAAYRESVGDSLYEQGGPGASRLAELEYRRYAGTLTQQERDEFTLLANVTKKLEEVRKAHWRARDWTKEYTAEELAELDSHNLAVIANAFTQRGFMAVPRMANLYVTPRGDVLEFDAPVTETSDFSKAQYLGKFETGTFAQFLRDIDADPAQTGVGVGTAARMALVNSTHIAATAARTAGLDSPMVAHGVALAEPGGFKALAAKYNGPLLYSKSDASSEYRELLRGMARGNREAAAEVFGRVRGSVADPAIAGKGQGAIGKILSWLAMRDPNIMSTANMRTLVRDTGLFQETEGGKNSFNDYDAGVRRRTEIEERWNEKVRDVLTKFDALSEAARRKLGELMEEATRLRIDPRKSWDDQPGLHSIKGADKEYDTVVQKYSALTAEERDGFNSTDKLFGEILAERMRVTREALGLPAERGTDEQEKQLRADLKLDPMLVRMLSVMEDALHSGIYFPLRRFGDFVVNARLVDAQGKEVDKVSRPFESRAEADAAAEEMRTSTDFAGWNVETFMIGEDTARASAMPAGVRKALTAMIKRRGDVGGLDDTQTAALLANIEQLYTELMPGMQGSKALMRRKGRNGRGIKGASTDMRRSVAATGQSAAVQIAHLQTEREISDARIRMREHARRLSAEADRYATPAEREAAQKRAYDAQTLVNHIDKMAEAEATEMGTAARLISQLGPMWYLVTPRFYMMQPLQLITLTLPKLASRVRQQGKDSMLARYRQAGEMIKTAYSEAAGPVWEQFGAGDKGRELLEKLQNRDNGKAWFSLREKPFNEIIAAVAKTKGEGEMLRHLNERNLISITMAYEVMSISKASNATWQKFVKGAMWPAQNLELANRIATGLAAYRLGIADGMTHEQAQAYADEVVTETQVDYSEANRPWLLSSKFLGNAAPLAMFQMYRQNMLWNTIYYGRKALAGDKEARRFFMGMMMTHALFAGAAGLPLIGGIVTMAGWLADAFDDEDEPEYAPMEEIRHGLAEFVGPTVASVVLYGVPRGFGADMSGPMGLNNIFVSSHLRADNARDAATEWIASLAGVPGSFLVNAGDAWDKVSRGDWVGGIESVSPKAVKDTIRAGEAAVIGLETKQGRTAVEPSFSNAALQLLGITPGEYADYYDARGVETAIKKGITTRKKEIFDAAFEAKTIEERREVQEMLRGFNKANPGAKITPEGLRSALRARAQSEGDYAGTTLGLSDRDREAMSAYLTPYQIEKE